MSELDRYDYEIERELIAQQPLPCRADARLMVIDRNATDYSHRHVRDLPELLRSGDCLVLNNTQVVAARLIGKRRDTGGKWQGLYLESDPQGSWRILGKTRGRLEPGIEIVLTDRNGSEDVALRLIEKQADGLWIARPETGENVVDVLERVGRVPLPEYIRHGEMTDDDLANYQTVFGCKPGAVAAPTAGLHFTRLLLSQLQEKGVKICYVTLHVGLGTFRPIKTESLDEHSMHSEWGEIDESTAAAINECREKGGRVIAVGTTAMRVLETAANSGTLQPWRGLTDLFIRPPYDFQVVDGLMTNFHWPRSTLLVLVSTFGGYDLVRRAYQEAIDQRYRFFSYGDAMLMF